MHVKRNDLNTKSRMKGYFHVRFRERLRVKFPWYTRQRNIRPATVERKNSLYFASEDGIACSATYHTILQTCRMMGARVLKYFQNFSEKFKEGCRDLTNMFPGKLVFD